MAAPTRQAEGAFQAGGAVQLTVPWPAHQTDDVALLVISSAGAIAALTTPAGFVEIPGSPQSTTGLFGAVFWCRATSGSMTSPVTGTGSNNISAVIVTARGCVNSGDPWDVISESVKAVTSTSTSITGDTTTDVDRLIYYLAARGSDFAANQYSGESDGTVTNLTERVDNGTVTGNGGGIGVWTADKAAAGAYGPMTATLANTSLELYWSIALKGASAAVTGTLAATQAADVGAFTGSVANPVSGTLSATQNPNLAALTGSVGLSGTLGATQDPNVAAFTGTVANPVTGVLAAVQDPNVGVFAGQTILGGNLTAVQEDNVAAFTGLVVNPITGTLTAVQDPNLAAFTGSVAVVVTGVLAAVQAPNVAGFTGNVANPATGAVHATSTVGQAGATSTVTEGASSTVGGLLVSSTVT